MAGITNIIDRIKGEADAKANVILNEAKEKASTIERDMNDKIEAEVLLIKKKCEQELKSISDRTISSSELKKKQITLDTKYKIVVETIEKAKEKLINLPDSEYIDFLKKVFVKNVPTKDCEILFNEKDKKRIKKDMLDEFVKIAKDNGSILTISDDIADIKSGFILRFGKVEGNCSFESLIDRNMDMMIDKVNNILFS
ncbi:MAG: hypothetical protein MJ151_01665 [Lachnospiraceae bacterium]|nr:hypothetical protein [Lachnospiraceae bacterium]